MHILVLLLAVCAAPQNYITEHFQMYFVGRFIGEAKGGTLTLTKVTYGLHCPACSIQTKPGQSGAAIAKRFVERLQEPTSPIGSDAIAEGPAIYISGGAYCLTGSETGFATRTAPQFVTVNYSPSEDRLAVHWTPVEQDPEERIAISFAILDGLLAKSGVATFDRFSRVERYDDRVESQVPPNPQDFLLCVGKMKSPYRSGMMFRSRFTRIHLAGPRQEDVDNLPFYGNVQPNWEAWSPSGFEEGSLLLRQGEKNEMSEKDRAIAYASSADTKYYFQTFQIKGGAAAEGGVYRRYLGLVPGHAYRVLARFNTFEAKPDAGDWSLSFHACADPPGQGLTVNQLQGREVLPNGKVGAEAGRVAAFGRGGKTTEGQWRQVATGIGGAAYASPDIVIPEGSTSLSAWVRVNGSTASRFGMDWSALEDVTLSGN